VDQKSLSFVLRQERVLFKTHVELWRSTSNVDYCKL